MIKISVTRGLVQLKRLEERINKDMQEIDSYVIVNKCNETNVLNGTMTKQVYIDTVKRKWQSLQDKLSLRQEIKDAIVESNAKTKVEIAGKHYTIAQAIEKKTNIEKFDRLIAIKFRKAYLGALDAVEYKNDSVVDMAERTFLGRGEDKKKNESNKDILDAMHTYIDSKKYEIVDPINMKVLKDTYEKEVLDFLAEVDQALTESNSLTTIEISKKPSDLE